MKSNIIDVIIIGAGAAGLLAAYEISLTGRTVSVIEAHKRTGGRMHTISDPSFQKPVELGPEFVHGRLPLTLELLKKAGIKKLATSGEAWQKKDEALAKQREFVTDFEALEKKMASLPHDISVAEFMQQHLPGDVYKEDRASLKNYVQGYYAGDIEKTSTYSLYEELRTGEDESFRIEGGYQLLVNYLANCCKEKGVIFYLGEEAQAVELEQDHVRVQTNQRLLTAKKIVVTVSIGVLQQGAIRFPPIVAPKLALIKKLGYGQVIKLNLSFTDAFWKDKPYTHGKNLQKLGFLFSQQTIPTWWTQHPADEAILTGWLGGPPAAALQLLLEKDITKLAMRSLSSLFKIEEAVLQKKLKGVAYYNWSADKYFAGAYSYNVVDGKQLIQEILQPVEHRIYFAGEGLHYGNEIGTVEAALISGREVAHKLIAEFSF